MVGRRILRWDGGGTRESEEAICPLCERPIPPQARQSRHHLVPKLKGGTHGPTVRLHQIYHAAIHARYGETEIARRLADIEALRTDPSMVRFLQWVRSKPPGFHARTRQTLSRKGE